MTIIVNIRFLVVLAVDLLHGVQLSQITGEQTLCVFEFGREMLANVYNGLGRF